MTNVLQHPRASQALRSLSPLERTDYEEMFVVEAKAASRFSAEQWARAAIEHRRRCNMAHLGSGAPWACGWARGRRRTM